MTNHEIREWVAETNIKLETVAEQIIKDYEKWGKMLKVFDKAMSIMDKNKDKTVIEPVLDIANLIKALDFNKKQAYNIIMDWQKSKK